MVWRARRQDDGSAEPAGLAWAFAPLLGSAPMWVYSRYGLVEHRQLLAEYLALAAISTGFLAWIARRPPGRAAAALIAALSATALAGLAVWRIRSTMLVSGDLAIQIHSLWSTWHRNGIFPNFLFRISIFAEHLLLILAPLLPFYRIFHGPVGLTLFLVLALAVTGALAAAPFRARPALRFLALAAFLLHPGIAGQFLFCYHSEVLALPFLVGAYLNYRREKARGFFFFCLAALTAVEYISFTVMAFSILAFLDRRSWFWKAAPLLLGLGWGAAAYLLLEHPKVTVDEARASLLSLSHLLSALGQRREFLEQLLVPTLLVLPFLGRAWVLALPSLALSLFVVTSDRVGVYMHTAAPAAAFLALSAFEGADRIEGWLPRIRPAGLALALIAVVSASFDLAWMDGARIAPEIVQAVQERAVRGGVTCSRRLSYHFAERRVIRFYQQGERTPWVILDDGAGWEKSAYAAYYKAIAADPSYRLEPVPGNALRLYHRLE